MRTVERVHVLFKTHLDIGFTDLAKNVIEAYHSRYIPRAIEIAGRLSRQPGPARFLWTTGSWLIDHHLKNRPPDEVKQLEQAIEQGHITWHGLPFTTHTELLDPGLFNYGLSLARRLDHRFGKRTIAAKMTDVPGHTIGMVPLMAAAGLKYLHLGVNPASRIPHVPALFRWRGEDGSELVVHYESSYGSTTHVDRMNEILVFAHTGDNLGPPEQVEIEAIFNRLHDRYPGAEITASTLDAFAEQVLQIKDTLPIVDEEIADSWIHGAASDPRKVAQLRELMRMRANWVERGELDPSSPEYEQFCNPLLLVAEHTWGLDLKTHLADFRNYDRASFESARRADRVTAEAIPDKYRYIGAFALGGEDGRPGQPLQSGARSYRFFESSWREQRRYIAQAVAALAGPRQMEAQRALQKLEANPQLEQETVCRELAAGEPYRFGGFDLTFGSDGSIAHLVDRNGKAWAGDGRQIGRFGYETFGVDSYARWFNDYLRDYDRTYPWADADFGKPGMALLRPAPEQQWFGPVLRRLQAVKGGDRQNGPDRVRAELVMPAAAHQRYGAPERLTIDYTFHSRSIGIVLQWFNKPANRLPEACWFTLAPRVANPALWKMEKLGRLVSPLAVVKDGNRNLHAVQRGLFYHGADGTASLETLDAPLVAPGDPRLLQLDNRLPILENGFHFNLYNNIWGTNFPMWYEEDARFRFTIHLESTISGAM